MFPFTQYLPYAVLGVLILAVINLILVLLVRSKIRIALTGKEGENLEKVLHDKFNEVKSLRFKSEDLEKRIVDLEAIAKRSFQKYAIVRYNAFNQAGAGQSFSLAVLDNQNTGFLLTSLHGQEKSKFYFRQIKGGKSPTPLSEEEEQAVNEAINS